MRISCVSVIQFVVWGYLLFSCQKIVIEDGLEDAGQACFKITTPNATFFYQKEAGGFSSILDRDGNDWIGFKQDSLENYPSSAASSYRGLPNLVFRSEDGGAGHPGFRKCISERISPNRIRSTSKSGRWQWTWTFEPDLATLTIDRVDSSHAYWFLYEGPVGGRFKPKEQYWGTDREGPLRSMPDHYAGSTVYGYWRWFYAGDDNLNRILLIAHLDQDRLPDTFSYLGNTPDGIHAPDGMVVFGFGRIENAIPLMREQKQTFCIGFFEKKIQTAEDHLELEKKINKLMQP